ncbi:MAG: hypothetical protein NTU76_00030 [Candidatus Taylorbacteria bacterium]|nr:hypothetical protein [Candidatus Taylorbacteria bacterium]
MVKNIVLNGKSVFPIGLGSYGFGEDVLKEQGVSEDEQIESMVPDFCNLVRASK